MGRKIMGFAGALALIVNYTTPTHLRTSEAYEAFKHQPNAVILYSAPWCAPCKAIEPLYRNVSKNYSCEAGEVDIDKIPAVQADILNNDNIPAIPSIAGYTAGNRVDKISGFESETSARVAIEKMFEEICKK